MENTTETLDIVVMHLAIIIAFNKVKALGCFEFKAITNELFLLPSCALLAISYLDIYIHAGYSYQLGGSSVVSLLISCSSKNCAKALREDGVQITRWCANYHCA